MFEGIVSGILSFFDAKVSVDAYHKAFVDFYVSRLPFSPYIILFCSSKIRWFRNLHLFQVFGSFGSFEKWKFLEFTELNVSGTVNCALNL